MIDWRRPHHRRAGEGIGERIIILLLQLACIAALVYGGWQFGRYFGEQEARAQLCDRVEAAHKELVRFKMWHYGMENFYLYDPKDGRLCYVTKPEDIDNPKKWRRTR